MGASLLEGNKPVTWGTGATKACAACYGTGYIALGADCQ
jgi:hypothetical protein